MATVKARRDKTAKEYAKILGVSPRTVQRMKAEPREEYIKRSREKANQVIQLKAEGLTNKDISEKLNIPPGTIGSIIKKAKDEGILEQRFILHPEKK